MGGMNIINIYDNYNSYFNADFKAIFELLSKIAAEKKYKIYLIGGIVRDMLLTSAVIANPLRVKQSNQILKDGKIASLPVLARNDVKFIDIDITVEGDAVEFAQSLAKECGAKIVSVHKSFGTVKVEINGLKIDLASTRSESYPKKGHLPHVDKIGCSLEEDVLRRDFTINSLAMSLNKENFAHLVDYVKGFEDLKAKKIRILHDESFVDDPTRIVRALKFSARLGFEIEENTLKLQREYLDNINYNMGQKRLKSEIKQTFELNSQIAFDKFADGKIYKLITSKSIDFPQMNIENLIKKYPCKHPWLVYFGVIAVQEDDDFSDKFELTKAEKNIILGAKNLLSADLSDDYKIFKAFGAQKIESLLIYAIFKGEEKVSHYVNDLKKVKLLINGNDILSLGCFPSKGIGAVLERILREKLNSPNIKREDELKLAVKYLKR